MKKIMYLGTILVMTMCVSIGFAQDMKQSDGKMQAGAKKNPDGKFMMMAAIGGMNEIGLSQTALSKSSNDEVKSFAQMMIDDHTKAGDELKAVADSKSVTLPMEMDVQHKTMNDKLSAMTGAAFDMEYLKAMVKDHEKTVAMFQKEAGSGRDAEAKAFAEKTLPTIQGHLEMAKKIMNSKSGSGKMGNAKMNGR